MSRIKLISYAILSGLLFAVPWLQIPLPFSVFIAFVPLLFIEDYFYQNRNQNHSFTVFSYSFLAFLVWNSLNIFWIVNATLFFGIVSVLINTFFMTVVFWFFHIIKRKVGENYGNFFFIIIWLAYEYIYINAEISFPWLLLGNAFANLPSIVQWYEYTGALGGSIWVLTINYLVFNLIKKSSTRELFQNQKTGYIVTISSILVIPIIFSLYIYITYTEKSNPRQIVVVQPNIDPYNEKFETLPVETQIRKMLKLAESRCDSNTQYVVFPETAIANNIWEENLDACPEIKQVRKLTGKFPKLHIVIGATSARMIGKNEPIPVSARKFLDADRYYDRYNTALMIDSSPYIQVYHKSILVIGVEKMPYPRFFSILEKYAIDLGGIVGSLATQKERTAFLCLNDNIRVSPAICYESIYGEFFTGYIRNGANLLFIITNDGWWGDTPGYHQHMSYARLRAIETRRSIARSANTGTSCFVNQRGDVFLSTKWWTPDALKFTLNANNQITFYVKHGDYIGRVAQFLAGLIILYVAYMWFKNRKKTK